MQAQSESKADAAAKSQASAEAEDKAKTILKNFPNNQFCWKVLGVIYLQNGKILEAINANNKSV